MAQKTYNVVQAFFTYSKRILPLLLVVALFSGINPAYSYSTKDRLQIHRNYTRYKGGSSLLSTRNSLLVDLEIDRKDFVVPNELKANRLAGILHRAPSHGVYIGVGTERVLFGAIHSKSSDGILMMDRDPRVVLYNRINIELIRHSQSRMDYKYLRLEASSREVSEKLIGKAFKSQEIDWFLSKVRSEEMKAAFRNEGIVESNYMENELGFSKLSEMAKSGKIEAFQIDFSNADQLNSMKAYIARKFQLISVIDLSNTWTADKYLSLETLVEIYRSLSEVSKSNALALYSLQCLYDQILDPNEESNEMVGAHYFGFRIQGPDSLESMKKTLIFLRKSISKDGSPETGSDNYETVLSVSGKLDPDEVTLGNELDSINKKNR